MSTDTTTSKLFAMCPPWLWPVLAYSLISLQLRKALLLEAGATDIVICLTDWGWAYIGYVQWPNAPVSPLDGMYRTLMGDPVETPSYTPPSLGIWSDDASADWARGTGIYALIVGCMERSDMHHPTLVSGTDGGFRCALSTLLVRQVRAPPQPALPKQKPTQSPLCPRTCGRPCWRKPAGSYAPAKPAGANRAPLSLAPSALEIPLEIHGRACSPFRTCSR